MAANYFGFTSGGNNQQYNIGTTGNYGGNYGIQQQQQPAQNNYMQPPRAIQPPQQQTYVAYGHPTASGGASVPSTSYPNTYSYQSQQQQQQQQQQTGFNKPAVQQSNQHQYYQQQQQPRNPPTQTNTANSSTAYFTNNNTQNSAMQIKQPAPQPVYNQPSPPVTSNFNQRQSQQSQQNISNYEKALINAASSIYQQHSTPTGVTGGGGASNLSAAYIKQLPYWKQKRLQQVKDPNKPIVATEVKAYLYAWLSKKKARPDYNITAHGSHPYRQTYVCEIVVHGYDYVAKGSAGNKKDSQTRAAWDFCDYLVREKLMTESELPIRDAKFAATNNKMPASYKPQSYQETKVGIAMKKALSNKVNFVGGNTLHLSGGVNTVIKSTPTAYPPITSTSTPTFKAPTPANVPLMPPPPAPPVMKPICQETIKEEIKDSAEIESKNAPVGEDYVTQVWTDGRVIRYRCKLCECEFNDPSAKALHIRGRRHRLSYKKKVDPNIEVEVKLNPKQKSLMEMKMRMEAKKEAAMEQQKKRMEWQMEMRKREEEDIRLYEQELYYRYKEELSLFEEEVSYCRLSGTPVPPYLAPPNKPHLKFFRPNDANGNEGQLSRDDQLIMKKHKNIYPTPEELEAVQSTVQTVETAFKDVSRTIHEQEMKVFAASHGTRKRAQPQRLITAVVRVGELSKGLLLTGDLHVALVLMCNVKPTKTMLNRVAGHLPKQLGNVSDENFVMKIMVEDAAILLATKSVPVVTIRITLTSTSMRNPCPDAEESATKNKKPDPPDILDSDKCCDALAALRRAKWFQAKVTPYHSCLVICRIFKDFATRYNQLVPLKSWAIELLTERSYTSATSTLSPTSCLQRVLEVLSMGVLLPDGPGIRDPCEKEPTDAAGNLSLQQREDITTLAQRLLRLVTFGKMFKILDLKYEPKPQVQKRSAENGEFDNTGVKKIKVEMH
uniref:zinc finger RNA-binding protein isoform X1 n=1 Tax=Ciona intestinalis TaxID=7719 RepID=UPI00089DCA9C|nr:zinc finger RNA-binding protein isoform X1 [Ciona intestinalis]|eukprot:XP_018671141.1 zinc finger RNA-binding protein isoform X1 [Ciona intestinalis]